MKIGDPVSFTDQHGQQFSALLTQVWSPLEDPDKDPAPPVNLVYVTADDTQRDPYGRQIARATSVVHRSRQAAPGMFWE